MYPIKVCLDQVPFTKKPNNASIASISKRIGGCLHLLNTADELSTFVEQVGAQGYSFCPATFSDNYRHQSGFAQQQLIPLDFDNEDTKRSVTFEEIKSRANDYGLRPLFAYHSLRSTPDHPKFRVIFMNDTSISDQRAAKAMQLAMGEIFPEADRSCYSDVSKFYLGGKELIYYDKTNPEIDIVTLFQDLHYHVKNKYGVKHYKEKMRRFSNKTGIALTPNGYLDVTKVDIADELDKPAHLTEGSGALLQSRNGGNSPTPIMCNRIGCGENPPFLYMVRFSDNETSTKGTSVGKSSEERLAGNHKPYRSSVLESIRRCCKLYREFESGERSLPHDESFHLLNNLIHVESGTSLFIDIMSKYPQLYDKVDKWKDDIKRIIEVHRYPSRCDKYCPYQDQCNHAKNILGTACSHRIPMEIDPNYNVKYYSLEEAQEDVYETIHSAYMRQDDLIHVIKAQVGIGKSYSYLQIMRENPDERFLIAAPTNLLKNELYAAAESKCIDVCKTPSLEEIKDEIPAKVWEKIQWFYRRGQHSKVHPYIQKVLESEDIPCLQEYMADRDKIRLAKGCIITTHRYMLTMDKDRLDEFDSIIIDEDIIFKSIVSNQDEVKISSLEKLKKATSNPELKDKIKKLLKQSETQSCIKLDNFKYDIEEDPGINDKKKSSNFDIAAFCASTHFFVRRAEKEMNLDEDTVVFMKPATLKDLKYIIVSATADEEIYCKFFGPNRIDFHECKQALYEGTLLQYPDKTMSRSCISSNKKIVGRLMERFNIKASHVITFLKEKIGVLHFGNTEGSNELEGDDILVVGTPYHADFLYKLIAFRTGCEFDEDEEMTPQCINRNGYRVWINTFTNTDLQKIHLWMMDSELDQAAGRARLLRHDCTVHLFSRYPMKQAKIVKGFQYDDEASSHESTSV